MDKTFKIVWFRRSDFAASEGVYLPDTKRSSQTAKIQKMSKVMIRFSPAARTPRPPAPAPPDPPAFLGGLRPHRPPGPGASGANRGPPKGGAATEGCRTRRPTPSPILLALAAWGVPFWNLPYRLQGAPPPNPTPLSLTFFPEPPK